MCCRYNRKTQALLFAIIVCYARWMARIEVVGLSYYPIKSCAGTDAEMVSVSSTGFNYDREWMLVDENNVFISQRKNPELARVFPRVIGGLLTVCGDGQDSITIPTTEEKPADIVHATVHGKPVDGQYEGPEISGWFSNFLDKDVRLLRITPELPRFITDRYHRPNTTNQVGFADGYSITLASQSSLGAFNELLEEPVPMDRFRPNIVVVGDDLEPYDEDYWRTIAVGEMSAHVVRACARCEIPDTNQVSGERGRQVRSALTRHRRGVDSTDPKASKGMFFMQNLTHEFRPGMTVYVGDELIVEEQAEEPNFIPIVVP